MEKDQSGDSQYFASTKNRWFAGYLISGSIWALSQKFKENTVDEIIVLIIAIFAGFFYHKFKAKIKTDNEPVKIVIALISIYIISAILIGVFTSLINNRVSLATTPSTGTEMVTKYQGSAQVNTGSASQDLQNKQTCSEAGQKYYEEDKKTHGENLAMPQFAYNAQLNTCLYGGGYINTYKVCDGGLLSKCTRGSWERFVKDVYTNKNIISIVNSTQDGENWTHSNDDILDFDKKYNQLMGF